MAFPQKKSGIGGAIALKPGTPSPPRYKSPTSEPAAPEPAPKPQMAATPEPAAPPEPPAQEAGEDYGAKLTADIDAVFEGAGIDKAQGRQIASQLFSAVAQCLGGDSEPSGEPPMEDMSGQSSEGY